MVWDRARLPDNRKSSENMICRFAKCCMVVTYALWGDYPIRSIVDLVLANKIEIG